MGLKKEGFAVLLADTNRENINLARLEGLPVYFGNALSDVARDDLELMGIGNLLAVTPNHEVNTLAGLHLVDLFGRSNLYQIELHLEKDRKGQTEGQGRTVFGRDILLDDLIHLLDNGAVIRKTKLTEEYDFERWNQKHGDTAVPLFLILESGSLRLFTVSNPPVPTVGQTILALGQPERVNPAPPQEEAG